VLESDCTSLEAQTSWHRHSPIPIKQYGGRRLYDIEAGRYVNLEAIADLVRERRMVVVQDAETGEDITLEMLVQIILGNA
jgi:polyhydroxyalkanoate synthesis repressor PhaR